MKLRKIVDNVFWLGALDWERKLFDSLIPLPDGTSYNAYLIKGKNKTALIDSVDISFEKDFMEKLEEIDSIDYIVSNHTEQDHSGSIPAVLSKYPNAKVVSSSKGKSMLIDHLCIDESSIITVNDGEELDLGGYTLHFIYTPWVHWPETMSTYVPECKILFSCDFFGSHMASTELFVTDKAKVYESAKRYYAEIMMPFGKFIKKNMEKISSLDIDFIAPSHGSIYNEPEFILKAYEEWTNNKPKNLVVIPYISMHGSTKKMVDYLAFSLTKRGINSQLFELSVADLGKLAQTLVDAATIVIASPTVLGAPHPLVLYASALTNTLRPRLKYASVIGSYGWSSKVVEKIADSISGLKVEILKPVLARGYPRKDTFEALDNLADLIMTKHNENGLM